MPAGVFLVQRGVTWVTPTDLMPTTYSGSVARLYATGDTEMYVECSDTNGLWIPFRLPLPNEMAGVAVKLTELIIYYRTTTAGAYIDATQVRQLNPADGTFTAALNHTADLGNGATGHANASLLPGPLTLAAGYPYVIALKQAGATAWGQVRVYGFKATWEATG